MDGGAGGRLEGREAKGGLNSADRAAGLEVYSFDCFTRFLSRETTQMGLGSFGLHTPDPRSLDSGSMGSVAAGCTSRQSRCLAFARRADGADVS